MNSLCMIHNTTDFYMVGMKLGLKYLVHLYFLVRLVILRNLKRQSLHYCRNWSGCQDSGNTRRR